jgi:hypothetical protein
MDQGTLVNGQINDGQKLIDRLAENGVAVLAACWMKESDGGLWYLYLVTPLVGEDGARRPAYHRINAVIRALPQPLRMDPFQKKVVGPLEPVGQAILDLQRRYAGRLPVWYGEATLGGVSIDAAYLYPPTVLAPARQGPA